MSPEAHQIIKTQLQCNSYRETQPTHTDIEKAAGTYQIKYSAKATQRGRHELTVAVNGVNLPTSPFEVCVKKSPNVMSKSINVIGRGFGNPWAIATNKYFEVIVSDWKAFAISVFRRNGERII